MKWYLALMTTSSLTSTVLRAGDGERADFAVLGNRYLLETGDVALIEHTIEPRTLAAPMHVHEHEDEYSFVLSGRMGAQIGDETIQAGPGDLVFKPRGVWHAFWSASDEQTRVLEVISPGKFGGYFRDLAPHLVPELDFAALGQVQRRYGLQMDLESVAPLLEKHGLHR